MSTGIWIAIGYVFIGLVVGVVAFYLHRKSSGEQQGVVDTIMSAVLWPITLLDINRWILARNTTYVPPLEQRKGRIPNYLAELTQNRRFDERQVQLLDTAYRDLFTRGQLSYEDKRASSTYIELERGEHVAFLVDDSPQRISHETEVAWRKRREGLARAHAKGFLVNRGTPWTIVVSQTFHAALHTLPIVALKPVAATLITLGEEIDRYPSTSAVDVRERLLMNGPLPCMLIGSAAAIVVELDGNTLYLVGVLGNRGQSVSPHA